MSFPLNRRRFLCTSGALGSLLACSAVLDRSSGAVPARIIPPVIDRLTIRVVVDGGHDIFIPAIQPPGIGVRQFRLAAQARRRTLESEWGLALYLESTKDATTRRYLLDFAFTPDVLNNNLDLLRIDVPALDALILSHGHLDHMGGLIGFLGAHRQTMRADLRLYTGGEDNFCYRMSKDPGGDFTAPSGPA